jgi:hypothetical protein
MKTLSTLLVVLATLTSCEHGGDYFYEVINKSDKNILLIVDDRKGSINKNEVSPNAKFTFAEIHTVNHGSVDDGDGFLQWFDTFNIKPVNTNLRLTKDISKREHWKFESDHKRFGSTSRYILTIESTDIQ